MNNAVQYKNTWLSKNSDAYTMWEEAKKKPEMYKVLDKHLKELERKNEELMKRYPSK